MVNQHSLIENVVGRLTDHPNFRRFFTRYLLAPEEETRTQLEANLWAEAEALPPAEQAAFRAELKRCFLQLPVLANDLLQRSNVFSAAAT